MFKFHLAQSIRRIALIVGLLAGAHSAASAAVWSTLPPVPQLPKPSAVGYTSIDSARIWWARYNTSSLGVPVLLLHGGLGSTNYFAYLIPALVADGCSVIAIDSRGHGRSTLGNANLSYELMASDVVTILNQLHIPKVDLVGWSDGGIIGLELAIEHRELINRLYAYGANVDPNGQRPGSENSTVFKEYMQRSASDYARISPTPTAFATLLEQVTHMWATEPHLTKAQLASIAAPVTIADGQHEEAILPEHIFYMSQAIPDANMMILPNVSHFAMLQSPQNFNDSVLFFLHRR
jgi:pimeloyl-ACP methyl ester carboxylesterase